MEDEKKEGFLRRTEGVTTVKAGSVKPRKAKLTGKTIESLRTSDGILARRIEKYNAEYERLVEIATEISVAKEEGVSTEEVMTDIEEFNRRADKLAKLGVSIIAFEDLNNKISLNGVGVKAIKVPGRLTRLLNGFTKAGREKNEQYAKVEDAIASVAKSVISENEEELTVDISKLEGLSVVAPSEDIDTADLSKAPLVGTLSDMLTPEIEEKAKGYSLFNKIWGSEEEVTPEKPIVVEEPKGTLTSLFLSTPAKKKEERTTYSLGGDSIFEGMESEPAKPKYVLDREGLFAGKESRVRKPYTLSSEGLFEGKKSEPAKPMFEVEDEASLVELISAAPTLFDALKVVFEHGYKADYLKEGQERPDFVKPEQLFAVVRQEVYKGPKTWIDTTETPTLVQLVQSARSWGLWSPYNDKFSDEQREIFNRTLAGEEIVIPEDSPLKDLNKAIDSLKGLKRYVIPCYEELSGNKVVLYEEEVAPLDAELEAAARPMSFTRVDSSSEEPVTLSEENEDEELVGTPIEIPGMGVGKDVVVEQPVAETTTPTDKKPEIVIPSIFEDLVEQPVTTISAEKTKPQTDDSSYDALWKGVVDGVPSEDEPEEASDYVIFSVMNERQQEFEREQAKLRDLIGTNETAVRFLTEEIVDPITGEPEFVADDIQTACQDRKIEPIDLAVEIIGKLPDKKRKEVLNRATTLGTVLSHPEGRVETPSEGMGMGM